MRAQDAELELADAALHAEKKSVIGPTGIIDAVEIDDPGLYEPAELEQVMPIPTVPGQARGVETEDGSHVASAESHATSFSNPGLAIKATLGTICDNGY